MIKKIISIVIISMFLVMMAVTSINIAPYITASVNEKNIHDQLISDGTGNKDNKININSNAANDTIPEYVGYIYQKESGISYPIVQHSDNEYYLNYSSNQEKSIYGAIFLDYRNTRLFDTHSIIYGHAMQNGSMFKALLNYADEEYGASYPDFYIQDSNGVEQKYKLSVVAFATNDSYRTEFNTIEEFNFWKEEQVKSSLYQIKDMETSSNIVTLSTCASADGSRKLVLHLVRDYEAEISKFRQTK